MQTKQGIGASDGIAIAKAYKLETPVFEISQAKIKKSQVKQEIQKVQSAFAKAAEQLKEVKEIATKKLGEEQGNIFQAHIEMINDPTLMAQITEAIENNLKNAVLATDEAFEKTHELFLSLSDQYFRERAADIKDIKTRVLAIMTDTELPDLLTINSDVIIIAEDLSPSQTSLLDKKYIKGFATNIGGRTSHVAIISRTLEIPSVVGLKTITKDVAQNQEIVIDGHGGVVGWDLSESDKKEYLQKQAKFLEEKEVLLQFVKPVAITKDGHEVSVAVNIGTPDDMAGAKQYGAKGVGLFRTEFLYMHASEWPNEEVQFEAYKSVLEQANNELVVMRTLDIGGDKTLNYYTFPKEMNPFLGYRAIRLTLDQPEIFKTQLKALLRASAFGKLGIMFPMVATVDELKKAKALLQVCREELTAQKVKFGKPLVGIMVEIPSAAVLADVLGKHCDFFSIGTNDLIQYSFAADRMSKSVSYLYQPLNPSLLRLIKNTIDGANLNGIWTGMCGEMAGEPLAVPLLLGLGLKEFSMSAPSMLKAKYIISKLNYPDCQKLAEQAIRLGTAEAVGALVENFLKKHKINF
ncbi:phosphoenolpyruvate--protein phosphotransferase [[Mycoplasma] testudinis]|uniref:phosphoenolpyruvate--protein phosphotransferase n=1 Tax=[Mycoplasma] testudinis TaxID=33924 RepID=UPI0004887535|nr:phosphoenolpyruvate--protein phosphotransferase [[Mycoplasma] testudinis]